MAVSTASRTVVQRPSAQDVREWAEAQGITEGYGERGRISPEVVAAFNKGKRGNARYVEATHTPTVTVTVKGKRGKTLTREVNLAEVRSAAAEAGIPVGERGRLSQNVLRAYVLGTLDTLPKDEKIHRSTAHKAMEGTYCPTCGQRLPGK